MVVPGPVVQLDPKEQLVTQEHRDCQVHVDREGLLAQLVTLAILAQPEVMEGLDLQASEGVWEFQVNQVCGARQVAQDSRDL
jgi:hypothetical protein